MDKISEHTRWLIAFTPEERKFLEDTLCDRLFFLRHRPFVEGGEYDLLSRIYRQLIEVNYGGQAK